MERMEPLHLLQVELVVAIAKKIMAAVHSNSQYLWISLFLSAGRGNEFIHLWNLPSEFIGSSKDSEPYPPPQR